MATWGVGDGDGDGAAGATAGGGDLAGIGGGVVHSTTHRCSPEPSSATARESARSEHVGEALRKRDLHCPNEVCGRAGGSFEDVSVRHRENHKFEVVGSTE